MGTFVVNNLSELDQAKDAHEPGDIVEFAKRRWERIELDGWTDALFNQQAGASFDGFEWWHTNRRVTVQGLDVHHGSGPGIQFRRGEDGSVTEDANVLDCRVHDSQWTGIIVAGDRITIRGGYIGKINRAGCDAKNCPELIRMLGGDDLLVENQEWGSAAPNGPLVRVWPQSEWPHIGPFEFRNIVGKSTVKNQSGIDVEGTSRDKPFPGPGLIRHCTILTPQNAFGFGSSWDLCPVDQRVLVVNNVASFEGGDQCARARMQSNLAMRARGSCPGFKKGPAYLSGYSPTAQSMNVIGKADPTYSLPTDYYGRTRVGASDLGAVEYQG